jgi:hypothetical protein
MTAPHRCKLCKHRPGTRRVTATIQEPVAAKRDIAVARVRKKPRSCECHDTSKVTP